MWSASSARLEFDGCTGLGRIFMLAMYS